MSRLPAARARQLPPLPGYCPYGLFVFPGRAAGRVGNRQNQAGLPNRFGSPIQIVSEALRADPDPALDGGGPAWKNRRGGRKGPSLHVQDSK